MVTRKQIPLVAVVGRPNVGKSTLFNRVVPRGDAVVDDFPGVTRDVREGEGTWNGVGFLLLDTGGLVPGTHDAMETAVYAQGELVLEQADVILFMIDAREGVTAIDEDIARVLRPLADKVVLAANKVENETVELMAAEGSNLGLGVPYPVSAQHGRGMGDLLDVLVDRFPRKELSEESGDGIRVALVGRPNVGKSSIANRLIGKDRLIVHEEPGTTRDAIDVPFRYDGTDFVLVDTAGLRRRSHVATGIEFYSTLRTRRSLQRCDVALLVLDVSQDISAQDLRIAGEVTKAGKSMVFVLNKWDLVTKVTGTAEAYVRMIREKFPLLVGSPVTLVSAKTGQRIQKLPETVRGLYEERRRKFTTSRLNDVLKEATGRVHPPLRSGSKPLKLYYVTQTGYEPPSFTVFVNDPRSANPSYRQYLKNFFREALDLMATPIRIEFRARR